MYFKSYKNWLQENKSNGVIVLLPGGFKPLSAGHISLIKKYVSHPNVKEVKVLIGPGIRNGIDQNTSLKIAEELLASFNDVSIEAVKYPSPLLTAYKYIVEEAEPGTYALAGSKKGNDYVRVTNFVRDFARNGKYEDMKPKDVAVMELDVDTEPLTYKGRTDEKEGQPISASILRADVLNDDYENFKTNYPEYDEKIIKNVWEMLKPVVVEGVEEEYEDDLNESFSQKDRLERDYEKLEDELAQLMDSGGSQSEIDDIKNELKYIRDELIEIEQEEQERYEQDQYFGDDE